MTDVAITDAEYADVAVEAEVFEAAGLSWQRFDCRTESDVITAAEAVDARALLVQYAPITDPVLAALPALRVVSRYGTGYDNVDIEAATRHGVWVSNVPVYGTDEVAIHCYTLMLACVRGLSYYDAARRRGEWPISAVILPHPDELSVGVIGAGRIGRRVIELATATFGSVGWYDPYPTTDLPGAIRYDTVDELLKGSNIVSVHLPLTRETVGTLGYREMSLLREPRILINGARGAIVDEPGLTRAIEDGTLFAAGLDVLANEPADPRGALLQSERVIASPHAAWASEAALVDVRRRAALNIVAALEAGRPNTPVNEVVVRP